MKLTSRETYRSVTQLVLALLFILVEKVAQVLVNTNQRTLKRKNKVNAKLLLILSCKPL